MRGIHGLIQFLTPFLVACACHPGVHSSPDPLCLSNASLHALQNLQPWAEEQAAAAAAAAAQAREAREAREGSLLSPGSPATRSSLASPGLV